MRLPPFNPHIAIIIGVLAISTSAVLVKLVGNAPSSIIANYRLLLAALLMAPIIVLRHRQEFRLLDKKDWILVIFAGGFLSVHFILWFGSLNYTSVASSVVLLTVQPIFAFIGTYFIFRERFSPGTIISMLIAIFGIYIVGWGDFQVNDKALFGDILALLSAIAATLYFLLGQKVRKKVSFMTYSFIAYGIGSGFLIIYNFFQNNDFFGYPTNYWLIFIALAVFPTFFGHALFHWALRWLSISTISLGVIFEPIISSLLAYLVLGEQVTPTQLLGGTIIIFGLFLFIVSTSRKRRVTISQKTN